MQNMPSDGGLMNDGDNENDQEPQYVQVEVGADDQQFIVYTDWLMKKNRIGIC